MISNRRNASVACACGPVTAIHEHFICGSAQTLLKPESTNVSALSFAAANVAAGAAANP